MIQPFRLLRGALEWLGLSGFGHHDNSHHHSSGHSHTVGHGHTHGVVDPTIATTARGIWAIKWSFVILGITAGLQLVVVLLSNSVALLADTIHNFGDAATAIPLWIAFLLARKRPSARFTYGFGRGEDLAGIAVVLIILFSGVVAGYQAIDRLINPQPITLLGWLVAAGILGFIGNEAVAIFRIRVGRQINSIALIADGYHARTDGLTSLAVVLGAIGVWLGFPLADPIVGLIITAMILGIVWQSGKAVLARMLDGVDPHVTSAIRHAADTMPTIIGVRDVRSRWIGHRLYAEADIVVDDTMTVRDGQTIAQQFRKMAMSHLPALNALRIEFVRPAIKTHEDAHRRVQGDHEHGIDVDAPISPTC
jgi:cation diffusion facilitator family transporter